MRRTSTRWIAYSALLALALLGVRLAEEPSGRSATRPQAHIGPPGAGAAPTFDALLSPDLDLGPLRERSPREVGADLFVSRSWQELEDEEARRNAPPPAPPPAPQAPPLPFAFIGKLIDDGKMTVFLASGDRNYVVRLGDTVDGNYRVEEIGDQTMTLNYLPLDSRQSLAIGSPALPVMGAAPSPGVSAAEGPQPLSASAAPTHDPAKLVWTAPPQVEIGEEFTIEVGLPAGSQPRSGRVELVYDGRVLAVLGGATDGPPAPGAAATARRAVVDVIGPGFPSSTVLITLSRRADWCCAAWTQRKPSCD